MNTIGATFILNQKSLYIKEEVAIHATYNTTILFGTFTPIFTAIPSDEYWELINFRWTGSGRITVGAVTGEPFFQDSTAQTIITFNQASGNRIILPPGTSAWIDNRAGAVTTVSINGIKYRSA